MGFHDNIRQLTAAARAKQPTASSSSSPAAEAQAAPPSSPPPSGGAATFDPADYTVDEVLLYLSEHEDETEAVVEAERAGKGRVTILHLLDG